MKINGVAETAIYVADVARSAEFYERLFGLRRLLSDPQFCAFEVPGNAVFLLFHKNSRHQAFPTPGGTIPAHGATGEIHFAFKIPRESLEACAGELRGLGIAIESRVDWPRGGSSLYFRDPDGHLVELITPGVWDFLP
jgi:catechol 2,3-dioxygenase-like lactoylglutathione lyase family enzyme